MSKIIDATCSAAGRVTAEGVALPSADVVVLSEGTKASEGALLVDGETALYIPSSATDIKDLIIKMVAIVEQVALIATNLDAVTVSPGSAAALITQLSVLKTQLDLTKDTLK